MLKPPGKCCQQISRGAHPRRKGRSRTGLGGVGDAALRILANARSRKPLNTQRAHYRPGGSGRIVRCRCSERVNRPTVGQRAIPEILRTEIALRSTPVAKEAE